VAAVKLMLLELEARLLEKSFVRLMERLKTRRGFPDVMQPGPICDQPAAIYRAFLTGCVHDQIAKA
jgi:hypothetical protein